MAFHLLRYAAEGDLRGIQKLIDHGVHIDASNVRKETALLICSLHGHIKCVEFLLSRGADPNRSSFMEITPLHAAIQNDHVKCVGVLLQYGSDLHRVFADYPTVVAFARFHGNPEIMRLLHAFMVDRGLGHHQPAQNYNAIVMSTCASASNIKLAEEDDSFKLRGIPVINLDDIKKPDHKHSFTSPFFSYVDGMWCGNLVTVKHAPDFNSDEFYHFRLRKEINLLRQLRHFRFPVAMAICLDPFCLIMERFYHSTLNFYVRDPNMDMEKLLECHLARIIRLMLDIAQALSHLHRKNWIHCHVSSLSILVCDGPRAKLGSLEFCERPGAEVEFMECFQDEMPWLAPELLTVGEARFPADIYSLAATFWECLTRHVPWSWLPGNQIPESRHLPIIVCWPNLIKHLLSLCFDEADKRPTADTVCRKLGEFMRLGIWLDRYQLDDMFKDWQTEHCRKPSDNVSPKRGSSVSSRSGIVSIALGKKYSSLVKNYESTVDKERTNPQNRRSAVVTTSGRGATQDRRRSAVVTTLVEEALTTLAQVGRPSTHVHEADIYKFGLKLAREIAELRGICALAIQKRRKAWAKVAMATRDLDEDIFDSLAGYEEVTFRRKHAHAANLKRSYQEKEEEKLKEVLERKRSLIRRHKRKNWACYTMLLCELHGILRRRDTVADDEDFEQEALAQSIARISSQMTRLSSVIVGNMADNVSGKFSAFPIELPEPIRSSDESLPKDAEGIANDFEHMMANENAVEDPEKETTDLENKSSDSQNVATGHEIMAVDTGSATIKTASSVGNTARDCNNVDKDVDNITSVNDESRIDAEDTANDPEFTPNPHRKKTGRIKSFFKRKSKKESRYMESPV